MTLGPIGLSYPKHRDPQLIVFAFSRTDSSTHKATLPKDAAIVNVHVYQTTNPDAAATYSIGLGATTTNIVNAVALATNAAPNLQGISGKSGDQLFAKQTSDQKIIGTFGAGSSTTGGAGYVLVEFTVFGSGEAVDD